MSTEQGGATACETTTASGGTADPTTIADQCYELEYAYLNEFNFAAGCDPFSADTTLQCIMTIPNQLGCPYEDPVNYANTGELTVLDVLAETFTELGCVRQLECIYVYTETVPTASECVTFADTTSIGNGYGGICLRSET